MPLSNSASAIMFGAWLAIGVPVSASANVITDWDEKAVAVVMPGTPVGVFTAGLHSPANDGNGPRRDVRRG